MKTYIIQHESGLFLQKPHDPREYTEPTLGPEESAYRFAQERAKKFVRTAHGIINDSYDLYDKDRTIKCWFLKEVI